MKLTFQEVAIIISIPFILIGIQEYRTRKLEQKIFDEGFTKEQPVHIIFEQEYPGPTFVFVGVSNYMEKSGDYDPIWIGESNVYHP